jgi:hypothetical protein
MSDEHAMFPLRSRWSHSYHHQYTLVTLPKIDWLVAVVVPSWRKLVYDVTSQKTCDVMYSTTREHDITSRTCDVTCSTPDYMTSLHRGHVTPCILPDMTSHHRTCDIMYSTLDYMASLHRGHVTPCILPDMTYITGHMMSCVLRPTNDVTSERTVLFTVNAFLKSNLNFSSFLYILDLNFYASLRWICLQCTRGN